MKIRRFHRWDVSRQKAVVIQKKLRPRLQLTDSTAPIRCIAGCDLALDLKKRTAIGGAIVYAWPGLKELERKYSVQKIRFPYVPGLLAFREAPVLLKVLSSLKNEPDLIVFDGQGIAHPRKLGIASHVGLFLNKPAIGCAKSRLCGEYRAPGMEKGCYSLLRSKDQKAIGAVLRTRTGVKPVFVSPGHRISLRTAIKIMLQCVDGFRIPKPTREADHYVEAIKRGRSHRGRS